MSSAFASGKFAYLVNKLTPAGTMIIDRDPGVTKGRFYLVNDNQTEWISFSGISGSGSSYTLSGVVRDIDPVAIPATSDSTGKTWLANQKCLLVMMHDNIFDRNAPSVITFATTAARDAALGADGVATDAYCSVYVTATNKYYVYNVGLAQWLELGTATPAPTTITGEIRIWSTTSAPSGWFLCDGSAISRTTYSELFAIIGTTYGAGDGSTTFNVPNLKGRIPVGLDIGQTEFDVLGETGGAKTHTLTVPEIPSHSHNATHQNSNTNGSAGAFGLQASGGATATSSTGGGASHNNLQPYIVMNYIIKY